MSVYNPPAHNTPRSPRGIVTPGGLSGQTDSRTDSWRTPWAFDGLSALLSAPEVAPDIVGIVIGSTLKGLLGGVIIGYHSRRVRSLQAGLVFGGAVGLFLRRAFLVAAVPQPEESHSLLVGIMLPGTIVQVNRRLRDAGLWQSARPCASGRRLEATE